MKICKTSSLHLTYCLNVHAGESWKENFASIQGDALAVRELVAAGEPFGLGLRLSNEASIALSDAANLAELKAFLEGHDLYVFTINGFPYGKFHDGPVKESVYAPDWRTAERCSYTKRLADILAALLPEGVSGSISTVPCSYKKWITVDSDVSTMVENLLDVAGYCAGLLERTGREIHIGLEPEPDCYIETTQEAVEFFTETIPKWARGVDEQVVRRYLGICFDTCHMLVQFEDLVKSVDLLAEHRIRLSKIQISAALRCKFSPVAKSELRSFCDPVYLHQVRACDLFGGVAFLGDLPGALDNCEDDDEREWRVHCHVPLYFEERGPLHSTSSALMPEFFAKAVAAGAEHFEIETYTFDVLPPELRGLGVVGSIAKEFEWVRTRIAE